MLSAITSTQGVGIAALGLALFVLTSRHSRAGLAIWILTICTVPYWIGIEPLVYLPPATVVGLSLLLAAMLGRRTKLAKADFLAVAFLALATVLMLGGLGVRGAWAAMILQWGLGYFIARTIAVRAGVQWTAEMYAWTLVGVACLSVIEFGMNWHPFTALLGPNLGENHWAPTQLRGQQVRSEWAFGHPIVLGAVLASAIPFVLTSRASLRLRIFGLAMIGLGLACTLSRGALLAGALTLITSVYAMNRNLTRRHRTGLLLLLAILGTSLLPALTQVSTDASGELNASSGYRLDLIHQVPADLRPFGSASGAQISPSGIYYRGFTSIDNAFLAVGISWGYVLAGLLLLGALIPLIRVLLRWANPADVAFAGQIPILLTVALITQYQSVIWFIAGLAVSWAQHNAKTPARAAIPAVQRTKSAR